MKELKLNLEMYLILEKHGTAVILHREAVTLSRLEHSRFAALSLDDNHWHCCAQ